MFRQLLRTANERLRLFLSERGRRARVIRDSLRRQPGRIEPSSRFVPSFRYGYGESEARGLELLKAEQRLRELTGAGYTAAGRIASGEVVVKRTFDPH